MIDVYIVSPELSIEYAIRQHSGQHLNSHKQRVKLLIAFAFIVQSGLPRRSICWRIQPSK